MILQCFQNEQIQYSSFPVQERIYEPSKDLEQLGNAVEVFGFVNEFQKYMVDLFSDESAEAKKFPVDAMEHSLEKIPLSWVLAVEEV